jgi:hypothetical protein
LETGTQIHNPNYTFKAVNLRTGPFRWIPLPDFNSLGARRGTNQKKKAMDVRFAGKTPSDIFLMLYSDVLQIMLESTNDNDRPDMHHILPLSFNELVLYFTLQFIMSFVGLPTSEMYWETNTLASDLRAPFTKLTFDRYKQIRHALRYENYGRYEQQSSRPESNARNDSAWKVRRVLTVFQESMRAVQPHPSEELSFTETIISCLSSSCPIKTATPTTHDSLNMNNTPTAEGFKFYIVTDCASKVIMNIELGDGSTPEDAPWNEIIAESDDDDESGVIPEYGKAGHIVLNALRFIKGVGHVVFMGSYYGSMALATHLRSKGFGLVSTMQTNRLEGNRRVMFTGKYPKPAVNQPRGMVKATTNETGTMSMFGFMDTGACYFIDTAYGPRRQQTILHRVGKEEKSFVVPTAIAKYKEHMGFAASTQQQQLRAKHTSFSKETKLRTVKWTIKFEEALRGFARMQAYHIHHHLYPFGTARHLSESDFFLALIQGMYSIARSVDNTGALSTQASPGEVVDDVEEGGAPSPAAAVAAGGGRGWDYVPAAPVATSACAAAAVSAAAVSAAPVTVTAAAVCRHIIVQTPPGSKGPCSFGRRSQGRCRAHQCVRPQRNGNAGDTTWMCTECQVYLHPGICFDSYHSENITDLRRSRPNPTVARLSNAPSIKDQQQSHTII